jgi:hypothetical protein
MTVVTATAIQIDSMYTTICLVVFKGATDVTAACRESDAWNAKCEAVGKDPASTSKWELGGTLHSPISSCLHVHDHVLLSCVAVLLCMHAIIF